MLNCVWLAGALALALTGRVVEDHSGAALASAGVRIFKDTGSAIVADLETDAAGRFEAPDLPAGAYRIEVSKPNHVDTTLRLHFSGAASPLLIRLVRCGVISGQVVDEQGRPVPDARVMAMPKPPTGQAPRPFPDFRAGSYSSADERGQYRLYNLPPGQYAVALSYGDSTVAGGFARSTSAGIGSGIRLFPDNARPQFFNLSGGEELPNVDFAIVTSALYTVSGKLELPASGGRFWLALTAVEQPAFAVALVPAEPDGSFRFQNIPPGSYHLFASGPSSMRGYRGGILDAKPYFGRTHVEVGAQNVDGISLAVQPGRSVSFLLRGACTSSAQVTLSALENWGATLETTAEVNSTKARAIENLAPGRYQLSVPKLPDACYHTATVLDLTGPTDPQPLTILIASAGSIRGRLAGAARPADFAVVLMPPNESGAMQVAYPDADSRFAFGSLRPGRYRIAARPASEASRARWVPDLARMFEIEVSGGAPTEMDLPAPEPDKPAP